jgi:uracil-DNA glycosylase family 4
MSSEPANNDLASLLRDAREQLTFFHELGVEVTEANLSGVSNNVADIKQTTFQTSPASLPITQSSPRLDVVPVKEIGSVPQLAPVAAAASVSLFSDLTPPRQDLPKSSETFEEIWADIGNCTRCSLYPGRTNIVHTDGNQRARLMFVGEAPGADEDMQGRPFVGRAGQLLTKIIEAIGFKRDEVLIGNVNRCRPPANRPPTPEEAAMCKPFLLREIAAVRPEVIVVLGNTAMRNLLDTKVGITKLRGEFQDYQGAKVMPTFHPAYLLRDPSKKKETWADLQKVRDYLVATRKKPN